MKYEDPILDVVLFTKLDIICTSEDGNLGIEDGDGGTVDPNNY